MAKRGHWALILAAQTAIMLAASALLQAGSLSLPTQAAALAYACVMWGVLPVLGGISSYLATRRGLNNYAAWIMPCICQAAAHYLLTGMPPESAGMVFLTAALSLVCAAAGEEMNRRKGRKDAHRRG